MGQTSVTSGRCRAGTTSDQEAWSKWGTLAWASAGGFSAGLGHPSWSAQSGQKSTESTLDAARRETLGWSRPLPRQALLGDDGSGQPQLPEHCRYQPGPAVGCQGLTQANGGPTQALFGKAEGMFHWEAPQVPPPALVPV